VRHSPLISVYAFLTIVAIAFVGAGLANQSHDDTCGDFLRCEIGIYGLTAAFLSLFSGAVALAWVIVELVIRAFRRTRPQQRSDWSDLGIGILLGLALQAAAWVIFLPA
jgi:hypothetical protein